MRLGFFLAGAIAAISVAGAANAALIADYRFDGNFNDSAGGSTSITNNGGTLGATTLSFGAGQGPTISGLGANFGGYTLETYFDFTGDSVGYRKIVDFKERASDNGLYTYSDGLIFYGGASGGSLASAGYHRVVLTRDDGSDLVTGYVDGAFGFSFTDSSGIGVATNGVLNFFRDDGVQGSEQTSGVVDYIRIYDTALSATEVAALSSPVGGTGPIPEPGAWALMIGGFGGIGAALRRRRTLGVALG